jgi:uncharacterized ion transporter superfamily protein YfcC
MQYSLLTIAAILVASFIPLAAALLVPVKVVIAASIPRAARK